MMTLLVLTGPCGDLRQGAGIPRCYVPLLRNHCDAGLYPGAGQQADAQSLGLLPCVLRDQRRLNAAEDLRGGGYRRRQGSGLRAEEYEGAQSLGLLPGVLE